MPEVYTPRASAACFHYFEHLDSEEKRPYELLHGYDTVRPHLRAILLYIIYAELRC